MILPLTTLLGLALALGTPASQALPQTDGVQPPNIVLIYADDLGYTDLACYGSELHLTPHIDALAKGGKLFTNAYANAPNCAPSRACLMSGQYGPRHGIYTVGSSKRGKPEDRKLDPVPNEAVLADEVLTLPEVLSASGYTCAQVGKWHLGQDPRTQGFHVNIGGNQAGHPKSYFSPYKNPDLPDGEEGEYLTDRLTDASIAFIQANHEQPFFLYLSHYAVHTPIQAKLERKEFFAKRNGKGNAGYAAMVESLDESVGRILQCLDDLALRENTLVLFTSDNGGHEPVTSMAPLRGAKGMLYEGGIREPFIVNWPGRIRPGTREATPIIATDIFPTLAALASSSLPKDKLQDGVDIAALFFDKGKIEERPLFWHFPAYLESGGRLKQTTPWRTTPAGAVRMGNHKLLEFFEDGRLELYDLEADLSEANNLASEQPEKAKELHDLLKAWRAQVSAPMPTAKEQ